MHPPPMQVHVGKWLKRLEQHTYSSWVAYDKALESECALCVLCVLCLLDVLCVLCVPCLYQCLCVFATKLRLTC